MGWWLSWVVLTVAVIRDIVVRGGDVTYDGRSLIIDGQRKILFSGSIHYPRSTPEVNQAHFITNSYSAFAQPFRYTFISCIPPSSSSTSPCKHACVSQRELLPDFSYLRILLSSTVCLEVRSGKKRHISENYMLLKAQPVRRCHPVTAWTFGHPNIYICKLCPIKNS